MRIVIEDYADVVGAVEGLRNYALSLLPVHLDPDLTKDKCARVFDNIAKVQNLLFAVHWDLSRLGLDESVEEPAAIGMFTAST